MNEQFVFGHVESWIILFVTITCWVADVQSGWVAGMRHVIWERETVYTAHRVLS